MLKQSEINIHKFGNTITQQVGKQKRLYTMFLAVSGQRTREGAKQHFYCKITKSYTPYQKGARKEWKAQGEEVTTYYI